jgi:hypothetical protein
MMIEETEARSFLISNMKVSLGIVQEVGKRLASCGLDSMRK